MNREIKFRVWIYDKQIEDGYLNDEYYQFHRDNEGYYVYEDWRDAEDGRSRRCIPMQFTGLHDKNGKEIYEGDILIRHKKHGFYDKKYIVRFEGFGFTNLEHLTEKEVIGNIFENPDLVKL